MSASDQDEYCNAVAKNAIASCMIVEDEDERETCLEEVSIKEVVTFVFNMFFQG